MGTGTFEFRDTTIQALLVEQVEAAVPLKEQMLRNAQSFYKAWEIDKEVHAEFRVLMNSGSRVAFRSSVEMPAHVVRRCREMIGQLNWLNTLSGKAVTRTKSYLMAELAGSDVRRALEVAMAAAERERTLFIIQMNDALHESHDTLVTLFSNRKTLIQYAH